MAVENERAFLADYHGGVHILDVSAPAEPEVIETVHNPGVGTWTSDVVVDDGLVWVANGYAGVRWIDVRKEGQPPVIGPMLDTPGHAFGVEFHDGRLVVADGLRWPTIKQVGCAD